jgi:hypothetical protein
MRKTAIAERATWKGKPGTAIQFQRRELVAVPVLQRMPIVRHFRESKAIGERDGADRVIPTGVCGQIWYSP